jgi:hypothetical protein
LASFEFLLFFSSVQNQKDSMANGPRGSSRYVPSPASIPRSDDRRWQTYDARPARWQRADEPVLDLVGANYSSAVLPAPPRPPRLAALLAHADNLGLSSSTYKRKTTSDATGGGQLHHFSCWRLRWCAFCLVVANALQASHVGAVMSQAYREDAPEGSGGAVISAFVQLAALLIALWSLLSQLLLWSDAAVMKVPEGVQVSAFDGGDGGKGGGHRDDDDDYA